MDTPTYNWKSLQQLRDPFNDAVNYKSRQEKQFFNKIFLRTQDLFECLKPQVYFLIGEKGSGKTAYATYLENNEIERHRCKLSTMTETQYKRFIALKRNGKLEYSDYANIWRPMLLAMAAQAIVAKSKGFISGITGKFNALEKEIESFNGRALNPEVEVAFELVTGVKDIFTLGGKHIKYNAEEAVTATDKSEVIKHHLLDVERRLKEAISELKLSHNHVLFIDGIDYRPEAVPYTDYLECIKGLGEAAWQLNCDFFSNIRDSKGRIKVVLLVRPDVFHSLNLYNSNSRLRDNAILLDWSTTEAQWKQSKLYEAADRYFSSQQNFTPENLEAADHYLSASGSNDIFKQFLRRSFQKPRDLLTLIKIAKDVSIRRLARGHENRIEMDVIRNAQFTKEYADYMLGEARNFAGFYMTQSDFDKFIKLFQYFDGRSDFEIQDFREAFNGFKNWINGESVSAVEYIRDPEALLQFFYDVNIIGYRENVGEGDRHYHFAYRERTLTNVAPKLKHGASMMINPGIAKALDIGLRTKPTSAKKEERKRSRHRDGGGQSANSPRAEVPVGQTPASKSKRKRRWRKPKNTPGAPT